jgi:choline-sulfatase
MGPDQLHGYARREVGDHSPNWIGVPRHDMGVLADANDPTPESLERSGPGQSAYELKDLDVAAAACAYLDEVGARRRGGDRTPFCLTVGFMLPHPPYVARAEAYARYEGRVPPPAFPGPGAAGSHPWLTWWRRNRGIETVPEATVMRARTAYYALVARLDALIGRILGTLRANGLDDDTLVVYSTDHGDQLGERGLWWKHTFFDESVKVPLLLAWPGRLPAGERRGQVVGLIDLTPTILEALAAPPLPGAQGRSFLGVARSASAPWLDETVSEYCTDDSPAWTGGMAVQTRMLRSGRWKLAYYHGHNPQLFDLEGDPAEQDDLGTSRAYATVRQAMLQRLLADWDPEAVRQRMRARRRDKDLLGAWARHVRPESQHVWALRPEQNRLDARTREDA